ncbi:MAG TPA: penicillin-binding transpeptidase domain-containing protein, partial [Ardenticatenaceae bacterium]|nr:penicillin-binding transpeptidase domain-containing protein [Ardenticatenaceae bacterium]
MEFDTPHLSRRDLLKVAPAGALALLLAACGRSQPGPTPTVAMTPTAEPESPQHTARAFLDAWQRGDYSAMYALLAPTAQVTLAEEAFTQRYQGILAEATVYEFACTVISAGVTGPNQGATDFETTYKTRLVGDVTVHPRMEMTLVDGLWRINWTPSLIVPELGAENLVRLFPRTSSRGIIYDRNGEIFATEGTIVTLGVVPGQIEDEGQVLAILSETLGRPPDEIRREYEGQPEDWFIPIGEIPFDTAQGRYDQLVSTPGVALRERAIRSYPYQHTASHVVGYVAAISAEELTAFGERGYEETDRVGKIGVEKYGEEILAGKKGGRLAVLSPGGQEVATLADVPAVQSRSLNLTLDFPLHLRCEQILGERLGSICVLDVATSRVLALASWPRFDPNAMSNELSSEQRQATASQPGQPLLNRATQGLYPPGSVFKIVTMATALERGGMGLEIAFDCPGFWEKLNIHMACWKEGGHGHIDLYQSLVQSCDVAFYEVGYSLYKSGQESNEEILSEAARGV